MLDTYRLEKGEDKDVIIGRIYSGARFLRQIPSLFEPRTDPFSEAPLKNAQRRFIGPKRNNEIQLSRERWLGLAWLGLAWRGSGGKMINVKPWP